MVHGTNCLWCLRLRELRRGGDVLAKQLGYLRLRLRGECRPATSPRISYRNQQPSTPKVALSALVWLLPPTLQAQEPLRGTSVQSALKLVCPTSAWCSSTGCAASVSLSRPLSITPFCRPGLSWGMMPSSITP
ncbi:hypothetical protein CI102_8037 [Trichoderma harzianum]|nr:hypothetical protein CI102_8037 [Trichoderma harzianum]